MKFIQQAYKGDNQWWSYVLTFVLLIFGWQFIGVIPLLIVAGYYAEDMGSFIDSANDSFATLGIDSNLYLILIILTFIGGLLGLLLGVKYIHKRKISTLITSREKVDWESVFLCFCFMVGHSSYYAGNSLFFST